MKLSEAMMLGAAQMPANDGQTWFGNNRDRNDCGCAIGRAWFAVGRTVKDWEKALTGAMNSLDAASVFEIGFEAEWPWLGRAPAGEISRKFLNFVDGKTSFETIVDYVRSIEPSCGECNRFECTCAKETSVEVLVGGAKAGA